MAAVAAVAAEDSAAAAAVVAVVAVEISEKSSSHSNDNTGFVHHTRSNTEIFLPAFRDFNIFRINYLTNTCLNKRTCTS
jgi:hypothetical protein